jgi:NhaP-type Na+/H+ or K+/H+ antiporter
LVSPVPSCPISEFTAEITIGIPLGLLLSRAIAASLAQLHSNESFQSPDAIEPRTYLAAALIVVARLASSHFRGSGREHPCFAMLLSTDTR